MTIFRFAMFVAVVGALIARTGAAREWTDLTETHTLEAELVECTATIARLRKLDGEVIVVDISKLSAADQRYLATAKQFPLVITNITGVTLEEEGSWLVLSTPFGPELKYLNRSFKLSGTFHIGELRPSPDVEDCKLVYGLNVQQSLDSIVAKVLKKAPAEEQRPGVGIGRSHAGNVPTTSTVYYTDDSGALTGVIATAPIPNSCVPEAVRITFVKSTRITSLKTEVPMNIKCQLWARRGGQWQPLSAPLEKEEVGLAELQLGEASKQTDLPILRRAGIPLKNSVEEDSTTAFKQIMSLSKKEPQATQQRLEQLIETYPNTRATKTAMKALEKYQRDFMFATAP